MSDRDLAYYVRVSYATLQRRSRQIDGALSPYGWDFHAATVAKESGFSYTAGNPSGAFGLYQINPSTADYLGVSYEDMKKSVNLQLVAGRKLLGLNYKMIAAVAPELIAAGGLDLWRVAYHAHNQGIPGTKALLLKLRKQGGPMTWAGFKRVAPSATRVSVCEEVAGMVGDWHTRYAELVRGEGQASASLYDAVTEDEGDGSELPVPPHLADPDWTSDRRGTLALVLGFAALGGATAGLCYWYDRRRARRFA